jgi:2-polyprenyl-3-methyl-5-hydroxy-6-metoxy-1,4-benzoquinol methylase
VTRGTGTHLPTSCRRCGCDFLTPPVNDQTGLSLQRAGVVIDATGREASFERVEDHLRQRLGGNGKVLDLGSGAGAFMVYLNAHGWDVAGVDVNARAVEVARSRGLDVQLGTVDDLEGGNHFDAIVALNALEYFARPFDALASMAVLLRPKGVLVLETPNTVYHRRQAAIGRILSIDPTRLMMVASEGHRRLFAFAPASIRLALTNAGFAAIHIEPAPPRVEGNRTVRLLRRTIFASTAALYRVSRRRIIAAPSMIVVASRP